MKGLQGVDFNDRYTLSLPRLSVTARGYNEGLRLVNNRNAKQVELVDRFGKYLFREEHFDFPLALDTDKNEAYFFLGGAQCVTTIQPIGVAVFEKAPYSNVPKDQWFLMWVWLHPFERGRGHLSRSWRDFKIKFGDFGMQPPLSFGMKAFMEKQQRIEDQRKVAALEAARTTDFETNFVL